MNDARFNIWQRNGGAYNNAMPHKLAWLSREHACLYERVRQGRMLYGGHHRDYFLEEGRTQFDFPEVRANNTTLRMYAMWNVLGLISNKGADLLFGEKPSIKSDDKTTQASIDGIVDRSSLHTRLHAGAVDASWAGYTFLEITREGAVDATEGARGGLAFVTQLPASEVFPVGPVQGNGQHAKYVRYATETGTKVTDGAMEKLRLLLETTYTAGSIERKCFKLNGSPAGETRGDEMPIDLWPVKRADGSSLLPKESTGLSRPSIVWIPNQIIGGCACSDYDGLVEQQDVLNAKHTQIARVHAKHSDPRLMAPAEAANPAGNVPSDHDLLFIRPGEEYKYLSWDAKLDLAHKDRQFALHALCTQAEFPASVLGLEENGADDSARKVRLKAAPALAKVARKAPYWQAAIKLAISIAIEAETGSAPTVPIAVEMRDGLPIDALDLANEIATLRSANMISKRRGLVKQGLDPAAIEDELAELDQEAKANMPSIFGEPNEAIAANVAATNEVV